MNNPVFKIKVNGEWVEIPALVGPRGENYILTEEDKAEIAQLAAEEAKPYIDEVLGVIENGSY